MSKKVRAQIKVRLVSQQGGQRDHRLQNGHRRTTGFGHVRAGDGDRVFTVLQHQGAGPRAWGCRLPSASILDHGGRIELDSWHPGSAGLCVNITLPLEPPSASLIPPALPPGQTPAGELPNVAAEATDPASLGFVPRVRIG